MAIMTTDRLSEAGETGDMGETGETARGEGAVEEGRGYWFRTVDGPAATVPVIPLWERLGTDTRMTGAEEAGGVAG